MYTIWFRFYGVHRIDVEGIVEACMAWDALSSQFGMISSRPCDGVACLHECCETPAQAQARLAPDAAEVVTDEDEWDDNGWDGRDEDDSLRGPLLR